LLNRFKTIYLNECSRHRRNHWKWQLNNGKKEELYWYRHPELENIVNVAKKYMLYRGMYSCGLVFNLWKMMTKMFYRSSYCVWFWRGSLLAAVWLSWAKAIQLRCKKIQTLAVKY
jgi:hypothetical protein